MAEVKEVIVLGASGGFGTLFSQVLIACCMCPPARPRAAAGPPGGCAPASQIRRN
jgi:hypothetical protein